MIIFAFVNGTLCEIVSRKIRGSIETPPPELTRRDLALPSLGSVRKALCVIGMRRSGKSSFLHQCRADLLRDGRPPESLLFFDFEDERLGDLTVADLALIPDLHARLYPRTVAGPVTFFFDEIQRIPDWERFARRLHDSGRIELFLSGSSARLLSREIATAMRGRSWELVVHPFSFPEFLRHHGVPCPGRPEVPTEAEAALMDHHFLDWLQRGGFPEVQPLGPPESGSLLQSYVDSVMLRDVIERHRVTSVVVLRQLIRRLLSAPCARFSVAKFHADLKSRQIASSRDTLHELLAHLEDAFLVSAVPIATDSEKQRQLNPRKIYPADTGLIAAYDRSPRANLGHLLESAVFTELQRRRMEVAWVHTPRGFEVDFLARDPLGGEFLLQACADPDDPATLAREVRALEDAATVFPRARKLLLIAHSRLPKPAVPAGIEVLTTWQWMMEPH